jgi:hypothetical protein
MSGQPSLVVRCVAALAVLLAPAAAGAATSAHESPGGARHGGAAAHGSSCAKAPVEVIAGNESMKLSLPRCEGEPDAAIVDELSILSRPPSVARPATVSEPASHKAGAEIAPGVHRLDDRIVDRLRRVVDHFAREGQATRIDVVSGFRPRGSGSFHSAGRALDFRVEGVSNESLVAFCKTLPDTGCGYYPHNVFVHMDVREPGAGHVAWVDTTSSVANEAPRETVRAAEAPAASPPAPASEPTPALAARPATATLGLSLAVPIAGPQAAVPVPTTPSAAPPVAPVVACPAAAPVAPPQPGTALPPLPQADSAAAHSERADKKLRAHRTRGAHGRHHAI